MLKVENSEGITLAFLNNLTEAKIKEALNGEFILNFVAVIEPLKTEFLYDNNNLINYEDDLFRVVEIVELHNEDDEITVSVSCEHKSYDLIKNIMSTFNYTNKTGAEMMLNCLAQTEFTLRYCTVTKLTDIAYTQECNSKQISIAIANNWEGELQYHRNYVDLLARRGQNRGTDFRFGKNLNTVKRKINYAENTTSYEVEVVQGSELEELGYYELGDTIRVVDERLNLDYEVRIIELEKDILTGMNSKVILGDEIKDLRSSFSNITNNIDNKINKISTNLNDAINSVNENMADVQQAIEDGMIETFYRSDEPVGKLGDLWFNTSTKKLYRFSTFWEPIEDKDITTAIENAQTAQTTADGKITSYYQTSMPVGLNGDLWIDTDDNKKLYRHNGNTFVEVRDSGIQQAIDSAATANNILNDNKTEWDKIKEITNELGNLIPSKMVGALNLAITQIMNSTGTFEQKDNMLYWQNQPTKTLSTFASMWNSSGISFSNSKDGLGNWIWVSAMNAEGIVVTKVLASAIEGLVINAVTLTAANITSGNIKGVIIEGSTIYAGNRATGNYTEISGDGSIRCYLNGNRATEFWTQGANGGYLLIYNSSGEEIFRVQGQGTTKVVAMSTSYGVNWVSNNGEIYIYGDLTVSGRITAFNQ